MVALPYGCNMQREILELHCLIIRFTRVKEYASVISAVRFPLIVIDIFFRVNRLKQLHDESQGKHVIDYSINQINDEELLLNLDLLRQHLLEHKYH